MKILSIETSCDETAVAIVEAEGEIGSASFKVLGNALYSQVDVHKEYGGVFPALAKREHAKNLVPLLRSALEETGMFSSNVVPIEETTKNTIEELLHREEGMADMLIDFLDELDAPQVDLISVTHGPGLEPALWVGINFAKALSAAWNIPVLPINHMEGHILSALLNDQNEIKDVAFPILSLLVSGGHTELVYSEDWLTYEILGQTIDDATGEAYDKVARMMNLPYPGGPEIDKRARKFREEKRVVEKELPRPMLHTDNCDFSFSGLKTAVLYAVREIDDLTEEKREEIAAAFEDAVTEVLLKKTKKALEERGAKSLVIGGGVSANRHIVGSFRKMLDEEYPDIALHEPPKGLTGDNAVMIALSGYFRQLSGESKKEFEANGNLRLDK